MIVQPPTRQEQLSQAVEKEVRMVIGDLTMQLIIARTALELAQEAPQQGGGISSDPRGNVTPVRPPNREGAA